MESYAIYTYNCDMMEWSGLYRHATVGFNAFGEHYFNHRLSGFSVVNTIACEGPADSEWNNVMYRLSLSVDDVQQARATCRRTLFSDIEQFGAEIARQNSQPCPCTIWQAFRDRRFRFSFDSLSSGYCFYERFNRGPLNLCCYSLR